MNKMIEQVYRMHRRDYVNRAKHIAGNWADAEDAVQSAFMQALEHQSSIRDPLHWIRAAARHSAHNTRVAAVLHESKKEIIANPVTCDDQAPNTDVIGLVRNAIEQLTPMERASLGSTRRSDSDASLRAHTRALKHLREILKRTQAYKEGVLTTCL